MTTPKVKQITCPECERVWPTIAEQGVVCELYGKCYQCFIDQVIKARDERAATADYTVQNCGQCGGLPPKVNTCVQCGGKGWETAEKTNVVETTEDTPKIVYQH